MKKTEMMPPKWGKLAADAEAKGLTVICGERDILVRNRGVGLILLENGTAYRCDVPLDLTNTIRTAKQARKILGL